jgi:cytochrome c2
MARAASTCVLLLLLASPARAQDIPAYYDEHCAACHTIGGGSQAGPDLKDITKQRERDWLIQFLLDPEGLVARRDPTAVRLVERWDGMVMPATPGLTRDLAVALLAHIDRQSAGDVAAQSDRAVIATDVAYGQDLFTGSRRLEHGGPPCLACHDLASLGSTRGGTLGPDLTTSHARLGGQRGLAAWLQAPPTPMMKALYRTATLTDDERHGLAAAMGKAMQAPSGPRPAGRPALARAAIGGALIVLVFAGVAWRKRFSAVRRPLVARTHAAVRGGSR